MNTRLLALRRAGMFDEPGKLLAIIVVSWLVLYVPTYVTLARTIWASDEQGHGPIILLMSAFLLYQRREAIVRTPHHSTAYVLGWAILGFGLLVYIVGHSQFIVTLDVGSQILVLLGILLIFTGASGAKAAALPLFFLLFMVPLPSALVAWVTAPLKLAVSSVASSVLYTAGFPVGRSGVILTIGQYQLLVADACAGLNSMFTLEALGLIYLSLKKYQSVTRNVVLACLVIPISFISNVTRVMIIVLITYYFGDAVGQGFIHEFSGLLLFGVALALIILADESFEWASRRWARAQR